MRAALKSIVLLTLAAGACADEDPRSAALAQISAQVEAQLSGPAGLGAEAAVADAAVPPTGGQYLPHAMRFHATSQEAVSALNALDIKSGKDAADAAAGTEPAKKPESHKAAVVSAFASIALETMHRATGAVHWLRQRQYALAQHVKTDAHNYKTWMEHHRQHAAEQIEGEVARLGSLTDEIEHLKQVMQDAISKDRSYQVQINELVSERQLQRTPPVMPAVVAAGLSDEQFNAATSKLHAVRAKAQQVIEQTRGGIHAREHMLEQGTKWVEDSKLVLAKWHAHQVGVYNQLVENGKKAVVEATKRVEAVERIMADAKKFHKDYLHALQRLHIEERIAALQKSVKQHKALKPADEYEEARVKAFVAALELEIGGLQTKLKKIPGDGKVVPPPAVWGVLAQYHSFAVHVPYIHPPHYHSVLGMAPSLGVYGGDMAHHQAVTPTDAQVDPSITSSVPTTSEATTLQHPGATWDSEIGNAMGGAPYNPWTAPSPAAAAVAEKAAASGGAGASGSGSGSGSASGSASASGAFFLEEMARMQSQPQPQAQEPQPQQNQQQEQPRLQQAFAGGAPVMPDLPPVPRADFLM